MNTEALPVAASEILTQWKINEPLHTPHPTSGHPLPSSDEGRGKGEGSRADSVHFLAFE
jgi:hypothetical protein